MRFKFIALIAAAVFAGCLASPLRAAELSAEQKSEFGKFIHDYLLANPQIIKEAIDELEKREKAEEATAREKLLAKEADKVYNSPNQAVVGNPDGDVTIVEFFDYNCGYCKQSLTNVAKLIEGDPKLRVVLKDFPILGPDSVEVAEVATAARRQLKGSKFWEFHRRLLGLRGHVGKAQALAVAKELGADADQIEKEIKTPATHEALGEVEKLADQLRFTGTPSWIVGNEAIVGGLGFAEMKAKVDSMHKCGKTVC